MCRGPKDRQALLWKRHQLVRGQMVVCDPQGPCNSSRLEEDEGQGLKPSLRDGVPGKLPGDEARPQFWRTSQGCKGRPRQAKRSPRVGKVLGVCSAEGGFCELGASWARGPNLNHENKTGLAQGPEPGSTLCCGQ